MARALLGVLVLLGASCATEQTDPPGRAIGLPSRDGGGDAASDAEASPPDLDGGDTTVPVGPGPRDAGPDARVDAPACTAASAVPAPPVPAAGLTLIAYSLTGFSGTQGSCGWSYGYVAPATGSAFLPMTQFDDAWHVQDQTYWTYLARDVGHPNGTITSGGRVAVEHWAVRRWSSNVNGAVRITGVVRKATGATGGNGIVARIAVDGAKLFEQVVTDETGTGFDLAASAKIGSTIDFVIDPNAGDDGADSTYFEARVWR
jgi:hypothetical protein